jgi:hypothetical protein
LLCALKKTCSPPAYFPPPKIAAVGLLKNLADIQIFRPGREFLEADDAVP